MASRKDYLIEQMATRKEYLIALSQGEKDKPIGPAKCPVYLKLPWIRQISETFGQSIKLITEQTFLSLD